MRDRELQGRVALVTGGSRGVGKGVAEALSRDGATLYVTGRTVRDTAFEAPCHAMACDHTDDAQVAAVFGRIAREHGRLDILVNNAWGGYAQMFEDGVFTWPSPFWEQPMSRWDAMVTAGLRMHYVASRHAARIMVPLGRGLIVNISYWAARKHVANVAYGVAKAGTDKLTADTAHELRAHGIAVVSLYPGLVRTEAVMAAAAYLDLTNSESPQFVGRAVSALARDPDVMAQSGGVVLAAECGRRYGFTDTDGAQPRPLTLDEV